MSAVFGGAAVHHRSVMRDIICGHPSCGEAFFEPLAHTPAIEFPQPLHGLNGLLFVIDHKTGDAFIDHLGDRAGSKRNDGRAAGRRFNAGLVS